jgi:hypothetical protein
MSEILTFSRDAYTYSEESKNILENAVKLAKMAIQKYHAKDAVSNVSLYSASVNNAEYEELNETVKKAMIKYAAKVANIGDMIDVNTPAGFKAAVGQFSAFREALFAIETKIIDTVNSKSEVEQSLLMAELRNLADGDSETFDIGSKSLFTVEDVGYSNNTTRLQYQFMKPEFLTPRPKDAAIAVDLYQFNAIGFDFGKQMAKLAISFRVAMYDSIIAAIFDTTPLTGTPFYKAVFAKTTWQELANRVAGANGSPAMAYGTNVALGKASDTVGDKWAYGVSEEFVKNGFIRDLYGVNAMELRQAVSSNDANYTFKVPDNKILVLTPATDKPVKCVMEGQTFVIADDGRTNSINLKTYKYRQAWATKIATQSAYAIQMV